MPREADEPDFPLDANGPAYTLRQDRDGIPLSYVGEKLGRAIRELHRNAQRCQGERDELRGTMYYLLVTFPGLHNMLGKANDHTLPDRLLNDNRQHLETWLRLVEREGDVRGLAELGD